MEKPSTQLRRGFKAECEKRALQYRVLLDLKPTEAIDPFKLAGYLNIPCLPHTTICGADSAFACLNCDSWSGLLLKDGDRAIIIYNDSHSEARTASSIMHELGHLLLGHQAIPLHEDLPLFRRNCTPAQEEEADCFSYTVLLPRPMIVHYAWRNVACRQIATETGLSEALVRYRINTSGVPRQFRFWQPFI